MELLKSGCSDDVACHFYMPYGTTSYNDDKDDDVIENFEEICLCMYERDLVTMYWRPELIDVEETYVGTAVTVRLIIVFSFPPLQKDPDEMDESVSLVFG
eukprot:12404522-Ditylum_brightwellii.AAC.1